MMVCCPAPNAVVDDSSGQALGALSIPELIDGIQINRAAGAGNLDPHVRDDDVGGRTGWIGLETDCCHCYPLNCSVKRPEQNADRPVPVANARAALMQLPCVRETSNSARLFCWPAVMLTVCSSTSVSS